MLNKARLSLVAFACLLGASSVVHIDGANAASYQEELANYRAAYASFQRLENAYWKEIERKKDIRTAKRQAGIAFTRDDFVLTQPPKYTGPKRPVDPNAPPPVKKPPEESTLPDADELRAAIKELYGWHLPQYEESVFKLAFAREALRHGVSAEQVVGVYALETGGKGPFDLVSGQAVERNDKCKLMKRYGRPLSTAIGYFQLLNANTSSTLAKNASGPKERQFSERLRRLADQSRGGRKKELRAKADIIDRMIRDMHKALARIDGPKNNWREFGELGRTKLGYAIHALNLDPDVGPMIQMEKLAFVRTYAINKGLGNLQSDRLELLNLVGYPRGVKMLEPVAYTVPTANFVSAREISSNRAVLGDKTVEEAVLKIRRVIDLRKQECGSIEFFRMFEKAGA